MSEKVRVGVIGLGGVASRIHLPACHAVSDIQIVGGCDPNEESRRIFGSRFKLPFSCSSATELLEKTRPDVVIVGTPPGSHFDLCREALESGAHVLCEKPFVATLAQADRLIELARSRNLLLRVNNQYRFMSFYEETKQRLDGGDFGRAFYLQAWQQMFHPPTTETNWRNSLKQYVLYEFGTHAFDLACFFFDSLPTAIHVISPRSRPEYDCDVLVHATLVFPDERLAVFSFNRVSHSPERYLEMKLDCNEASVHMSLGGVARLGVEWSKAAQRPILKAGLLKGGQARVEKDGLSRAFCSSRRSEFASATARHLRLFLSEMQKPARSLDAVLHSRSVLELVFAGYQSASSGETVRLPLRGGK